MWLFDLDLWTSALDGSIAQNFQCIPPTVLSAIFKEWIFLVEIS